MQMTLQAHTTKLIGVFTVVALAYSLNVSAAVDVDAAKALARENNCFKCHGVDKEKDGPSYKKVADKYRGKPGAEEKLIHHVTSGEKAKFADGHEEEHKNISGKASPESIKNLVDWILSL
jgi:cytochrome c